MKRTRCDADEFDGGEVVFRAIVVADGDASEAFDAVEEAFDEVRWR